jgi:hypothetical protein
VRRRGRAIAAGGALALAIGGAAAAVTYLRAPASPPPPCADAAAHLAGIWDDARREAVGAAFLRTGLPSAGAAFDRVAAAVDRYAADWAAIRTEACEATEVKHEQPRALLELRMACLDRARIQLRALGDALIAADAETVRGAVTPTATLPALDACSDLQALRAIISPPLKMAARTEIPSTTGAAADPQVQAVPPASGRDLRMSMPDFRLPFLCGEAWQLARRGRRGAAQVDFTLPRDEPADGLTVIASAPGWVSRTSPDDGEVVLGHGNGWYTAYQHMTEIGVSRHQYVGRSHPIGRVGSINVKNAVGGPGPARLRYAQIYQPGVADVDLDRDRHPDQPPLTLEREPVPPGDGGPQILTSGNSCVAGGVPGGAAPYDIPDSTRIFSPSHLTLEIATRRSFDHALFERRYDQGWNSAPLPHTIVGQPAVAVFRGELHILARKSDGTLFDHQYSPFTGWKTTYLDGKVSGDPDVTVSGWRKDLHVIARGPDGYLYRWVTATDGSWSRRVPVGRIQMVGTPAIVSHYDALYIVARGGDASLLVWRVDRRGMPSEWRLTGATSDPDAGIDPRTGSVSIVARGADDRIYRWRSNDLDYTASRPAPAWSEPELVDPARAITGTPATIPYRGAMHVFARGTDGALHHWWNDGAWRWEATGGVYSNSPDVVVYGRQIQTIGRGMDGTLYTVWFDPVSGLWNPETQGVPITD